jgi:hypothetical protein
LTVVIAKQFADTICIVSDTMISDEASGTRDAIPGRLKIVTLSPTFSVAYAGHANQALDAIREAVPLLKSGGPDAAVEYLRQASAATSPEIDFIVAAHRTDPELRRVWQGRTSKPLEHSLIGDASILPEVERRFKPTGVGKTPRTSD